MDKGAIQGLSEKDADFGVSEGAHRGAAGLPVHEGHFAEALPLPEGDERLLTPVERGLLHLHGP